MGLCCVQPSSPLSVCVIVQAFPNQYVASNCTVVSAASSASQIRCITEPGVGPDLFWGLTLASQVAPSRVGPTAYGRPVVSAFSGHGAVGAETLGSQVCGLGPTCCT
jgi:hypothetical protein